MSYHSLGVIKVSGKDWTEEPLAAAPAYGPNAPGAPITCPAPGMTLWQRSLPVMPVAGQIERIGLYCTPKDHGDFTLWPSAKTVNGVKTLIVPDDTDVYYDDSLDPHSNGNYLPKRRSEEGGAPVASAPPPKAATVQPAQAKAPAPVVPAPPPFDFKQTAEGKMIAAAMAAKAAQDAAQGGAATAQGTAAAQAPSSNRGLIAIGVLGVIAVGGWFALRNNG